MWDSRTQASVMSVNHGYPVEDIVVFPSGGLCASAGNFLWVENLKFGVVIM